MISSPTTTLAKIAPGRNSKSRTSWLKTLTPVMSLGSRSGVNWIRRTEAVDRAGQGLGQHRLADAGDVLDEQVALGQQGGDRHLHDGGLALDDGVHRPASEDATWRTWSSGPAPVRSGPRVGRPPGPARCALLPAPGLPRLGPLRWSRAVVPDFDLAPLRSTAGLRRRHGWVSLPSRGPSHVLSWLVSARRGPSGPAPGGPAVRGRSGAAAEPRASGPGRPVATVRLANCPHFTPLV